jgi:hypothetical protein
MQEVCSAIAQDNAEKLGQLLSRGLDVNGRDLLGSQVEDN